MISHVPLVRALALVVETGLADRIEAGPANAETLGGELGLHVDTLHRLLRMLASEGIFREDEAGHFHSTPMSSVLTTGAENSIASLLRLPWQDLIWRTYLAMPHTLRTGEPAFDHAYSMPFFDLLTAQPEIGAIFDTAMAMVSGPEDLAIAAAFDFSKAQSIVDVGAGKGGLLAAILSSYADVRATLFDQARTDEQSLYLTAEQRQRCTFETGDFFERVPDGADLYILKRIIHDWEDADAVRILTSCRDAVAPGGRILIIDAVVPAGNQPDPIKSQDVGMLLLTGGRERSEKEFQRLCDAAGLELLAIHVLPAPAVVSVIETRPVG